MDENQKLNLQKMIKENDVQDNTQSIRDCKHSSKIRYEVDELIRIKTDNPTMTHEELDAICMNTCFFLFSNYTDIYNRTLKDELNITILYEFLQCLKKIEDGVHNQHEASFEVGTLLKKLYVDSALKKADKIDKKYSNDGDKKKPDIPSKKIGWAEYKKQMNEQ